MRSFLVILFLVIYLIILTPIALLLLLLRFIAPELSKNISYFFARTIAYGLVAVSGTTIKVEGNTTLNECSNYLLVPNHDSLYDSPIACLLSKTRLTFVSKKELVYFPMFNLWLFLIDALFLDRKNIRKGIKTINQGIDYMKNGQNVVIFPQGTTRNKGEFLPFKRGSIQIATKAGAKIIPMTIYGSHNVYSHNSNGVQKATVYIYIFDKIETKDLSFQEKKDLIGKIEQQIKEKYDEYESKYGSTKT